MVNSWIPPEVRPLDPPRLTLPRPCCEQCLKEQSTSPGLKCTSPVGQNRCTSCAKSSKECRPIDPRFWERAASLLRLSDEVATAPKPIRDRKSLLQKECSDISFRINAFHRRQNLSRGNWEQAVMRTLLSIDSATRQLVTVERWPQARLPPLEEEVETEFDGIPDYNSRFAECSHENTDDINESKTKQQDTRKEEEMKLEENQALEEIIEEEANRIMTRLRERLSERRRQNTPQQQEKPMPKKRRIAGVRN
ncbi:hypothetical protein L228DRAFT_270099 [Xylona heveae TC161]|uniref:Uncharacterized protein n=1 Tax=Xylona heveae (strain CBS 132557 / TC161) TaxID=1328760 RepID=A0A165FCH3_XYLHT|nr:hypothetical protein L228DRAFT_270099 [Xylona heveae TC161]KZF20822.1 hypothetical protein L228DRAFT_270099 [Xylona heveae TC161]